MGKDISFAHILINKVLIDVFLVCMLQVILVWIATNCNIQNFGLNLSSVWRYFSCWNRNLQYNLLQGLSVTCDILAFSELI